MASEDVKELVVLVDDAGHPIGTAEKLLVHSSNTPLHLAFSCYVFNDFGQFLLTRRAYSKRVFPGVWTNSGCGHPAPSESFESAINRRMKYELGLEVTSVEVALSDYRYETPLFNGIKEHEICPVFVAKAVDDPKPNPEEVAEWKWINWEEFVQAALADDTDEYSWWCKDQLKRLLGHPLIQRYETSAR